MLLICGDRKWQDEGIIRHLVEGTALKCKRQGEPLIIVEGEAKGADQIAGKVAEELGLQLEKFPALWNQFGRGAGPIRNKAMLEHLNKYADGGGTVLCFAFHHDLTASKGTKDMVRRARKSGIPTYVISGGADARRS